VAVAVVQSAPAGTFGSTTPLTPSLSGISASNFLLLLTYADSVSGVTDNASSHYTWTQIKTETMGGAGSGCSVQAWTGVGGSGGTVTVSVPMTPTDGTACSLHEISGANSSSPVINVSGVNPSSGGAVTSASIGITPVLTGGLTVAYLGVANNAVSTNPSPGWTNYDLPLLSGINIFRDVAYQNGTASTLATASWAFSGTNGCGVIGLDIEPLVVTYAPPAACRSFTAVSRAATWMERASGLLSPERERIYIPRLALAR